MIEQLRAAAARDVSRETFEKLEAYVTILREETQRQNLIASSTVAGIWDRHILDSAQLLRYLPNGAIVDVGSGAGLPGLILAILGEGSLTLIEPRRLRSEFLIRCVEELSLSNVRVIQARAESCRGKFAGITARAVASIDKFLGSAHHLSHPETVWVLPKGRSGEMELAGARASWQGQFRLEPSITEGDAVIVVATDVQAKRKGRT